MSNNIVTQDTKDFNLIEQSNGDWIVECCHCGFCATYTNEITAQVNVPLTPHCEPKNTDPLSRLNWSPETARLAAKSVAAGEKKLKAGEAAYNVAKRADTLNKNRRWQI